MKLDFNSVDDIIHDPTVRGCDRPPVLLEVSENTHERGEQGRKEFFADLQRRIEDNPLEITTVIKASDMEL